MKLFVLLGSECRECMCKGTAKIEGLLIDY